jgi:hypothetical protein
MPYVAASFCLLQLSASHFENGLIQSFSLIYMRYYNYVVNTGFKIETVSFFVLMQIFSKIK